MTRPDDSSREMFDAPTPDELVRELESSAVPAERAVGTFLRSARERAALPVEPGSALEAWFDRTPAAATPVRRRRWSGLPGKIALATLLGTGSLGTAYAAGIVRPFTADPDTPVTTTTEVAETSVATVVELEVPEVPATTLEPVDLTIPGPATTSTVDLPVEATTTAPPTTSEPDESVPVTTDDGSDDDASDDTGDEAEDNSEAVDDDAVDDADDSENDASEDDTADDSDVDHVETTEADDADEADEADPDGTDD